MNQFSIIIIDDEEAQLLSLKSYLTKRGYEVFTTTSGKESLNIINNNVVDLVISDFRMPEWNGLEVLKKVKELNPEIDVVIMTAFGNTDDAVQIMKAGAYDYLNKPVDLDELENLIHRIQEKHYLVNENKQLKEQLKEKFRFDSVISQSGEMEEVINTAGRVAKSKATVLIRGESGTGKELIARAIHFGSQRGDKPFITVNVAAITETIMESELFGHEKGAFTGANQQRIGKFEQANGGTLFIDEVGEIPLSIQVKLLRALQFGQIERLGGNNTINLDVRIVTATHRNLEEMMSKNQFREDLFYRLNVVSINIPPLRNHKTDIQLLVDHFIGKYASQNEKNIKGISKEALDRLLKYDYPGNIRELENMIEHAVVMSRTDYINISDLPKQVEFISEQSLLDPSNIADGHELKMKAFETALINKALQSTNGNQSAAARKLGITERHLRSRLEKLNLKNK